MASPTGVLYFKIGESAVEHMLEHIVFVPYLGSLFQNIHELSRNQRLADVFVPYWGSLFQNESKHIQSHVKCVFVPCWGSLFQNMQIPMWIVSLA